MKAIAIVSTQMQLINCVEYMHSAGCDNCILFVAAKSQEREKQILEVSERECYKDLFPRTYKFSLYDNRVLNFFLSFLHLFRLYIFCILHDYNTCMLGNYKEFIGRYLVKKNTKTNVVVVDDGLATLAIEKGRQSELKSKMPFIFIANKIFQLFVVNESYIPSKVLFFSIFKLDVIGEDRYEKNQYSYLRECAICLNIPNSLLDANIVFLGQPLYFKGILSEDSYSSYLKQFAKKYNKPIPYYAHPEETFEKWSKLGCGELYMYIDNVLSFEVFASLLRNGTKVVSFYTSALTTIDLINPSLRPEAIYINEINGSSSELCVNIEKCYDMFRQNGIQVIVYDENNIDNKE